MLPGFCSVYFQTIHNVPLKMWREATQSYSQSCIPKHSTH